MDRRLEWLPLDSVHSSIRPMDEWTFECPMDISVRPMDERTFECPMDISVRQWTNGHFCLPNGHLFMSNGHVTFTMPIKL